MTTITNPSMLSYALGELKLGMFKKASFLKAYWKTDVGFPNQFIDLIQLTSNRMDYAATEMKAKDRKSTCVYLSVFDADDDSVYYASSDVNLHSRYDFVGYIVIRSKDLAALSKSSMLLIGDMHQFNLSNVYRIDKDAYNNTRDIKTADKAGIFQTAYETMKSNLISALVNYSAIVE